MAMEKACELNIKLHESRHTISPVIQLDAMHCRVVKVESLQLHRQQIWKC